MIKFDLINLDCANCAAKIEAHLRKLPSVRNVDIDFATLTLHIDTDDIDSVRREIKRIEPQVDIALRKKGASIRGNSGNRDFNPRREVITLSISFFLFLILLIFENKFHILPWRISEYVIALTAYLLAGWNVLAGAYRTIRKGELFDENVLMTIATFGAFAIHAVSEAVGVMIFFKIGEILQSMAVTKSRKSIRALLEIRPDFAALKTSDGLKKVSPESVRPGDIIIVKAGEKIPLDGIIEEGTGLVNTSALTGESVPSSVKKGDVVLAGEINTNGFLTVKVSKLFSESSISKILDLVENATVKKAKTEQFVTRFARYYTPLIVILSLCIALVPPLFFDGQSFSTWLYRALVLLVISCPCALVISIPLGYFGGIGGASKHGVLVKGSNFIDALASVKTIVFDKTGTLTKGTFSVRDVVTRNNFSKKEVLAYAALAETHSNHPIAKSIIEAAQKDGAAVQNEIIGHQEISGYGVKAHTKDCFITVGNDALLHRENIEHDICSIDSTVAHIAVNNKYAGYIIIGDEIKEDSFQAINKLKKSGIHNIGMLTGDNESSAKAVASELHLDFYYAGLLPEEKVVRFEMISSEKSHNGKIAFVGDGVNDSPVIARADVGIAMGALGSDAAIETADVVLMTDHPSKVADAIMISKKTQAIVWQNIVLALAIKALFIGFGAFGMAGMWEAVFADMGTALLAILNSTRAHSKPKS